MAFSIICRLWKSGTGIDGGRKRLLGHQSRNALNRVGAAQRIAQILLWLFVINLGIALGAGLYESRIVVPQWISYSPESGYRWNVEAARQANTGVNFWVYVTTVPLTLLTLANLFVAWRWSRGELRRWWLGAGFGTVADKILTFGYFIPVMLRLMGDESIPPAEAVATALQWARFDWMRHAIDFVAWLAALRAFGLFHARGAELLTVAEEPSEHRMAEAPPVRSAL